MDIQQKLHNVETSEQDYKKNCNAYGYNSSQAVDAFHEWYKAVLLLLKDYRSGESKEFQRVRNLDISGNGDILHSIYQEISPMCLMVIDDIEKELDAKIMSDNQESSSESKVLKKIFISHSSKDSGIISRFVEQILRLGLGLAPEDIAFTSEETFGVEPGENIAKYIRDNICGAEVVLLMISSNYKASDICLNEMGAAWAFGRKCISVVLPNADFSYLGWLSSLEKAVQLYDKSQLVSLSYKLAELLQIDLRKHFIPLLSGIDRFLSPNGTIATPKAVPVKNVLPIESSQVLKVFDVSFNSVCLGAGEYVIQINLRMRSDESDISLRRVFLRNKKQFTGTSSEAFKELEFKSYLDQDTINLTSLKKEDIAFWKKEYPKKCHQVIDVTIEKGHNLSLSFCEYFFTVRECDGYDELQLKGWSLVIQYNVDAEMIIPLELVPVDKVFAGKYWHN